MNNYIPGLEKAELEVSASRIGIRESRRIVGEYTLSTEDALGGKNFEDGIALCGYALDIHQPDGDTGKLILLNGSTYAIPYRCLLPKEIDNLLAGGRCISASHEALASFRVMPPCFAIGEAAGTAAALSLKEETVPRFLDLKKLRAQLLKQGAVLE
jgi:hypothetical protein